MFDKEVREQVAGLAGLLNERGWRVATAESCTGGLISAALTAQPGSSHWFEYGFVVYADAAKAAVLGVEVGTLTREGSVSETTVLAMARGARQRSGAECAVAVSGIAGPDGGSTRKPVGTVWIGWDLEGRQPEAELFQFDGDRDEVRLQTVRAALKGLADRLRQAALHQARTVE